MSYKVEIRNNKTGEIRSYLMDMAWGEGSEYWWTAGNFGCDCNRELCFKRAGGESEPEDEDIICGDDCYAIRIKEHGLDEFEK